MKNITATGVENQNLRVELTEGQKNIAIDNELVHSDNGTDWKFFDSDISLLESLKKQNPKA